MPGSNTSTAAEPAPKLPAVRRRAAARPRPGANTPGTGTRRDSRRDRDTDTDTDTGPERESKADEHARTRVTLRRASREERDRHDERDRQRAMRSMNVHRSLLTNPSNSSSQRHTHRADRSEPDSARSPSPPECPAHLECTRGPLDAPTIHDRARSRSRLPAEHHPSRDDRLNGPGHLVPVHDQTAHRRSK